MNTNTFGSSTYKELCSLASDLNLTRSRLQVHELGQSPRHVELPEGSSFWFHMIAAKAGEQLAPFLPQLVPRLYRYQFDPNLSIRQP
ncbi:unnamed protein product [Pleuronectes platessa]|uniref:Uncharacterized protein n=1 Tax=Pleuronectes platessa TaxID=8262 RepID=A0A9N7V0I3_PLEPL|nr:unnamed protein product [Pleuronectes platessa]